MEMGYRVGSSPLTRGARERHANAAVAEGIIPAHAGSTTGFSIGCGLMGDHPRSRGEHPTVIDRSVGITGSSPLTRGGPRGTLTRGTSLGIIPAHAGRTLPGIMLGRGGSDHPRSRGEHPPGTSGLASLRGSSPLTRGALSFVACRRRCSGIIPAHAGSTPQPPGPRPHSRDHPRSRGEHRTSSPPASVRAGSSPLTRGARSVLRTRRARSRIIPAHAGSTRRKTPQSHHPRDHPRSRGEHP